MNPTEEHPYSPEAQTYLLRLARATLVAVTHDQAVPPVDVMQLSPALQAERACFVTLRFHQTDALRGCTGTLVARNPLAQEVVITTRQTALNDPRFMAVQADEVDQLHIEISVLTPMERLFYTDPDDLLRQLRPGIDGVTLQYERHRATFLPQVWERIAKPTVFLSRLCEKMGLSALDWRQYHMHVYTYQSIVIEELRNPHT